MAMAGRVALGPQAGTEGGEEGTTMPGEVLAAVEAQAILGPSRAARGFEYSSLVVVAAAADAVMEATVEK